MGFDLNRYEKRRFHENVEIDKKIKALYLWFDYEVSTRKLNHSSQLTLIDNWIANFLLHELYEVVPAFKLRRAMILAIIASNIKHKKIERRRFAFKLYYRFYRIKFKKLIFKIKNSFLNLFVIKK